MQSRSVALDGPAGAGKSTLAKKVAGHFNLIYVDTGALYRCIGLYALRSSADPTDEQKVAAILPEIKLEIKYDETGMQRMILCGQDVTDDIRLPEVSKYASDVSAIPAVRDFLFEMQVEMADKYDVIMDGRDIGTVVLPDAGLKVFITADADTRANRRYIELVEKGIPATADKVKSEMLQRDKNDSERDIAPLKMADDAVLLDTTNLDFEQSFDALCKLISDRFDIGNRG